MGLFTKKSPEQLVNRATRVPLDPLHRIHLTVSDPPLRETPPIQNISFTGLGLKRIASFSTGQGKFLTGTLTIATRRYDVLLKVIHLTGDLVGCSFERIERHAVSAIRDYLRAELSALAVNQIPSDKLQADPGGLTPHWYLGQPGGDPCELYFLTEGSTVKKFHLVLSGNYLEGGEGAVLRTGTVVNEQRLDKPSHKGSSLIRWSSDADDELVQMFRRFVSSMKSLAPEHRSSLLSLLGEAHP